MVTITYNYVNAIQETVTKLKLVAHLGFISSQSPAAQVETGTTAYTTRLKLI